jgi:hypothetical protein
MRPPQRVLAPFAALVFGLLAPGLSPGLRAQSCARTFGPMGLELRTSQTVSYDQIWSMVARGTNRFTCAWSEGQDVYARQFDLALNPLGSQFLVDTALSVGIQDEPAVCAGNAGTILIAWSERNGYDGSLMGIFARVYDAAGQPITGEFLINTTTWQSQWRPLIAPTPSGGYVVAWSGDGDGNSYFKILGPNGLWLTGDVPVNTYTFDAQVDPAPAVAPNGNIFIAFVDYSSHGGVGSGINLWGRVFDASGNPLQNQEFPLTTFTSNGDQRDPRVAADGLGRFFVAWEDQLGDGSGYGIFARIFDSSGVARGPEFQVNTSSANDQRAARIAVDSAGRAVVAFEDNSAGWPNVKVRARRFDGQGLPIAPDFVVNESPSSGAVLPSLAIDPAGNDLVIGFQGPGLPGNGQDVFAKRYTWSSGPQTFCTKKVNSLGCRPAIDFSGTPSATSASPFLITGTNILNQKLSLLFYGYGSAFTPFQGVTICVAPPLKRLPTQNSGGNVGPLDCSGFLSTDFNQRIQGGIDPGLVPGATISARWYYRDGQDPAGFGTGLSDAVRFAICP